MSEIRRIIDQLEREHTGDPWHGSPLKTILDDVTAAAAAAKPLPGAHSIWELVVHITGWKNEARRRLSGAPAGEPEGGDWPEPGEPSEARWGAAVASLDRAQADLVDAIRNLPEPRLYEATNDPRDRPLGAGVSCYVLLHGIVQHDAYHAGQIALLKHGV